MITGELKNKIDQLWEMLWTEGNANPLTNIEQLTYLLFMKDLDRVAFPCSFLTHFEARWTCSCYCTGRCPLWFL